MRYHVSSICPLGGRWYNLSISKKLITTIAVIAVLSAGATVGSLFVVKKSLSATVWPAFLTAGKIASHHKNAEDSAATIKVLCASGVQTYTSERGVPKSFYYQGKTYCNNMDAFYPLAALADFLAYAAVLGVIIFLFKKLHKSRY